MTTFTKGNILYSPCFHLKLFHQTRYLKVDSTENSTFFFFPSVYASVHFVIVLDCSITHSTKCRRNPFLDDANYRWYNIFIQSLNCYYLALVILIVDLLVHGWVSGHPHNASLNTDFGDYTSLVYHLHQRAAAEDFEFLLFDSGDVIEGWWATKEPLNGFGSYCPCRYWD